MKTNDYSIFKKHPSNRNIDKANLANIMNSLMIKNLLKFRPIMIDTEMRVVDGQHRLEAARRLGIEVYYQVHKEAESDEIIILNVNHKNWVREDYLNYYISKGNVNYQKVKDYCNLHDIRIFDFLQIDPHYSLHKDKKGVKANDKFLLGTYVFPTGEDLETCNKIVGNCKKVMEKLSSYLVKRTSFVKTSNFRKALVAFVLKPDMELDLFLSKLEYKINALHASADRMGYIMQFVDIYNWRNNNPIAV